MIGFVILALALQTGAPAGDAPVRLDGTMKRPRLVKSPPPEVPEEAEKAWLQGLVVVEFTVAADGRVVSATALRGDPPLTDAAIKAVKKWRYEPLVRDGRPTSFIETAQVSFPLARKFWLPQIMLPELIDTLSSRHEAVRVAAANQLGAVFTKKAPSSDKRWAERELTALLEREQSPRVREAAERALAALARGTP